MVKLIEDQFHQYLIEQEKERFRTIEAEKSKNEETKNNKVKRKSIPNPRTRPSTSALFQESGLFILVREYVYDLSIKRFLDYCSDRGILHVAGEPGSKRWKYSDDLRKTKSPFLADSYFHFSEKVNGKQHRAIPSQKWKPTGRS